VNKKKDKNNPFYGKHHSEKTKKRWISMSKKSPIIIAMALFFLLITSTNAEENYRIVNIKTDKSLNIEVKSFDQGNIELELTVNETQTEKLIPIQIYNEYVVFDKNKEPHNATKYSYYGYNSFETTQDKKTIKVAYKMEELIKFGYNTTIIMLVAEDYNTGIGFDFNWTKVTTDANVMPTGSDRVYVEQDQAFYDPNLVLYINFDDVNADGSGVLDDTNNGNDGLLINGADIDSWGMWDTNAGNFDGLDDSINLGDIDALDGIGAETISVWVRPIGSQNTLDQIVGKWSTSGGNGLTLILSTTFGTDDILWGGWGGSIFFQTAGNILPLNKWTHIVGVFDGSGVGNTGRLRVYANGVLAAAGSYNGTVPTTTPDTVYDVRIGTDGEGGRLFSGFIEEVKIYSRALTVAEIQQDYNSWMVDAEYYSPVQDAGETADWDTIEWEEITDVNNSLTVDYRGCSTSDCGTAGDWLTGLSGGGITHSNIHADGNQFFQYRVNFDTNKASWNTLRSGDTDKGSFAKFNTMTIEYTTAAEGVCDCPSSGNWEINDGSICTLSTLCNAPADVHISSGSLNITSSGILSISSGYKAIVEKGEFLYREKGGKIVIEK